MAPESPYRIYGVELSPYSVKVRSYFRYKAIPHQWIIRRMSEMPEFQRYAKLPLVPLVVTPQNTGIQDSTPIMASLEQDAPHPSIYPSDDVSGFISLLLEEYADEWVNKPMFHYRWRYEADQNAAAIGIARELAPVDAPAELVQNLAESVKQRMIPRISIVGSSDETKDVIENSYVRQLAILQSHLKSRDYLFGARPSFADFAYFGQMYELRMDPTPGGLMRSSAPAVFEWVERMVNPSESGPFQSWSDLAPTLTPLLEQEVAKMYLPWADENQRAIAAGNDTMSVELAGEMFRQRPSKYAAKSFSQLLERYQELRNPALDQVLDATGCLCWLGRP